MHEDLINKNRFPDKVEIKGAGVKIPGQLETVLNFPYAETGVGTYIRWAERLKQMEVTGALKNIAGTIPYSFIDDGEKIAITSDTQSNAQLLKDLLVPYLRNKVPLGSEEPTVTPTVSLSK